jgi:hypothetical protein
VRERRRRRSATQPPTGWFRAVQIRLGAPKFRVNYLLLNSSQMLISRRRAQGLTARGEVFIGIALPLLIVDSPSSQGEVRVSD